MLFLIGLSVILVFLVHWIFIKPYGYWKKRGVPGPKPTMLLGNLGPSLVMKQNLGQIYEKIYNDYKDYLYVGYYKFRQPGIILRDIDLIKDILIKEFPSFHDNDIFVDPKIDPLFGNNPFALKGQKWKEVRSLITSAITTSKVKNMFYIISNICKDLVQYIEQQPTTKNGLNARDVASKYTTDVVASCAFGLEAGCLKDEDSEFTKMGKKFLEPSFLTGIKHMFLLILPTLSNIFKLKAMPDDVQEWFIKTVADTIKYREENNIKRPDYLDMLMELRSKSGGTFGNIDVTAQALTFYGDGFETSAIALSHTLYELAEHPEIQTKLRKEIDIVLAKYKGEISYDCVQEMSYLDNVLQEGLRMYTPALFIARLCTKRFELPSPKGEGSGPKVVIEPGTTIIIPTLAIHHEPNYYPNPNTFDPDRFNDENKSSRPKCTFLAFGEGPRICLGSKFGLAQTKAAMIAILSNFEVTVNPKTQRPLKMNPQYFLTDTIGGLWLNFIKRKK